MAIFFCTFLRTINFRRFEINFNLFTKIFINLRLNLIKQINIPPLQLSNSLFILLTSISPHWEHQMNEWQEHCLRCSFQLFTVVSVHYWECYCCCSRSLLLLSSM